MNKKAVILAAAVAALAAVLAGALLLRGGRTRGAGGEGTPYPYEWVEKRDGTVVVRIGGDAPEGYVWETLASDAAVTEVASTEGGFTLTPLAEGRTSVESTLRAEDWADDRLHRVTLLVDASRSGRKLLAAVLNDASEALPGAMRGGEELGCPYRVWREDDGSVSVFLTEDAEAPDWRVARSDGAVARGETFTAADGGVELTFYAGDAGETEATLYSAARGLRLTVALSSDGEGELTALSHEMTAFEVPEGSAEGCADFLVVAGEVTLPEGMTPTAWSAVSRGRYMMGSVELTEGDEAYRYTVVPGADAAWLGDGFNSDDVTEIYLGDGAVVYVWADGDGAAAWWDDGERAYLLTCGFSDTARVLETVLRFQGGE